jgi:very-short-patch-repair endonuclease
VGRKRNHAKDDGEIAAVATAQEGIISIHQLVSAGVSERAASRRADRHRIHRIHRGVYAVGHEAISSNGRLLAATLACGPGSAISHLSAAALWGLRDAAPVVIDVIVPCETGRKIDGIRSRRCRYPTPAEVTTYEGVPCTTPARTLVDVAGFLGRTSLRRAVEQAAVLKLLDWDALNIALAQAKGRPGIRALQAILAPWREQSGDPPRLRSILEARLLPALIEAGLPRPRCNVKLRIDDERLEVDLLWEKQRLVVEADGEETHGSQVAFQRDRRRDQILAAAGYRTMRVTWRHLNDELEATVARIGRTLSPSAQPPHPVVP